MRNRRRIALCLLTVSLLLSGCQLAKADGGSTKGKLIGALITQGHLELQPGVGISMEPAKVYAELSEEISTAHSDGQTNRMEYVFPGIEGYALFEAFVPEEGGEGYYTSQADTSIGEIRSHTTVGAFGSEGDVQKSLEGTLFAQIPRKEESIFSVNPVYQDAQNRVYVTTGSGLVHQENSVEGEQYSFGLTETNTLTKNGKDSREAFQFEIHFHFLFAPQKLLLLQFDKDSVLLKTEELPLSGEDIPEKFVPEPEAEYLVLEVHKADGEGKPIVSRTLYGKSEAAMTLLLPKDKGLFAHQYVEIEWTR